MRWNKRNKNLPNLSQKKKTTNKHELKFRDKNLIKNQNKYENKWEEKIE